LEKTEIMEDWAKRLNAKMAGFTEPVAGAAPVLAGAGKVAAGLWWALGAVAAAAAVAGIVVLSRPAANAPAIEVSAPLIAQEQHSEEILPEETMPEETLPMVPVKMLSETVPETVPETMPETVPGTVQETEEVVETQPHDSVIEEKPENEKNEELTRPIQWENPVVRKRRHFNVSLFAHIQSRKTSSQSAEDGPVVDRLDTGNGTPQPHFPNYGTENGRDGYGEGVGATEPPSEEEDKDTKADTGSGGEAATAPAQAPLMHRLPLHLGVRVSTEIGSRFNLETGLDYARFVSASGNVDQRLHYIGLPVRLRYDFLDARYYSAGVSVGAEAMKCVAGNGPDKPWLFDMGASLEAKWKITPLVGIYAETGIGRYFHTGESQHYYTQNPFSVSFSVGFRFEL
jgi:hypothetical protein